MKLSPVENKTNLMWVNELYKEIKRKKSRKWTRSSLKSGLAKFGISFCEVKFVKKAVI